MRYIKRQVFSFVLWSSLFFFFFFLNGLPHLNTDTDDGGKRARKRKTFVARPLVFIFSLCRVCKTGHVWNGCGLRPPLLYPVCVGFLWKQVWTHMVQREKSLSLPETNLAQHTIHKKLYLHIIIHLSVIFILFSIFLFLSLSLSLFLFLRLLSSSTCQRVNKQQHGREKDRETG